MRAAPLLLLGAAALLASCAAQEPIKCDLSDRAGLASCIEQLLNARSTLDQQDDMLYMHNLNDGNNVGYLQATNIRIHGLSRFTVRDLHVEFRQGKQIAVRAVVSWPNIRGGMDISVLKCMRVMWRQECPKVLGRSRIDVAQTNSTLTTTLNVSKHPHGHITVTASDTEVSLHLGDISIDTDVPKSSTDRSFRKMFGKVDKWVTPKLLKWWDDNKFRVEAKAKQALDQALKEKVAVQLSRLLKF